MKDTLDLLARRRTATYDQRCYDIAKTFMEDEGLATDDNVDGLAIDIQQLIDEALVAAHAAARADALDAEYQKHIDYRLEDRRDAAD